QYTATASIVIDPPAGTDARGSITVSPVYFESLRAYETLASSDTLFERALDKFHLRGAASIETLKRRILKVTKIKDTKILEIAATLPDPRQAQAMAQFIAEQTVSLNLSTSLANDRDLLSNAIARTAEAQKQLNQEQAAWRDFSARNPYESLRAELEALSASQEKLQADLVDARVNGPAWRVQNFEKQQADLTSQIQAKARQLSDRDALAQQFDQKIRSLQTTYDAVAKMQQEAEASMGMRVERLRVVDPGVVPERASFPNVPLNVLLAIAVAFIASLTLLTLTYRPEHTAMR
ncbi:MAG TPA: hypothetical protein VKS01_06425, partial [Bryobacteraceae bacterium]|nr:hypothetical protein [Bryobacteraceae bacterium]